MKLQTFPPKVDTATTKNDETEDSGQNLSRWPILSVVDVTTFNVYRFTIYTFQTYESNSI